MARVSLQFNQRRTLTEYIEKCYAASTLDDTLFAHQASTALGFQVSPHHVSYQRTLVNVPNNCTVRAAEAKRVVAELNKLKRPQPAPLKSSPPPASTPPAWLSQLATKSDIDTLVKMLAAFEMRLFTPAQGVQQ